MSKIEIDFDSLKYNLYDILNVSPDADIVKIKKSFMKIIKTFHPDKNSDLEEEIYYHIILANQILLNKESRKKYDKFLLDNAETFTELKNSFQKSLKEIDQSFPDKKISNDLFAQKLNELNKKHGYSENITNDSVMDRFSKVKGGRDNIKIEREDIKNMNDFNNKFNYNKTEGKFKDQIVEYHGHPSELSTYVIGEQYTNLSDLDKLYVDDSVQSSKYSSLDRAFMLQPQVVNSNLNKSYEERMNDYKSQTDSIKNMKPSEYLTTKFNDR